MENIVAGVILLGLSIWLVKGLVRLFKTISAKLKKETVSKQKDCSHCH